MRYQRVLTLPVVVLIGSLVSIAQEMPKAPTALSGNWHLSGSFGLPVDGPRLIVSLIVEGGKVMGGGDLQMVCAVDHAGLGTNFFLLGQIAADGTFTLTDLDTFAGGEGEKLHAISISGRVPEAADQWSGKYTLRVFGKTKCTNEITSDFVATRMPVLKGAYLGKLIFQDSLTASIKLEIEQGELTRLQAHSGAIGGRVSLHAKMTVTWGSSTQTPVTYVADPSSSYLNGGEFWATFAREGEATRVVGSFSDASTHEISVMINGLRPPDSSPLNSIGVRLVGAGMLTRQ